MEERRREITHNEAYDRASELYVLEYVDCAYWEYVDMDTNIAFYTESTNLLMNIKKDNITVDITFRESSDSKPCYIECSIFTNVYWKKLNLDWNTTEDFTNAIYEVIGKCAFNK